MSGRMEQPFYHDDSFMLGFGHADVTLHDLKVQNHVNPSESYRNLKSDLYQTSACDVSSLKLASPELERLILQNSTGVLTSPTPGQYPYGRCITDEQEGFAEGFVKALDDLHKIHRMPPPNVSIGAGDVTCAFGPFLRSESPIYATLNAFCPTPGNPSAAVSYLPPNPHGPHPVSGHGFRNPGVHAQRFATLKEEPQTVPDMHGGDATPPVSPIDMENQERIKAERKRLRNRVAATKCRKRKLERIARLEDKVKVLKSDNAGLSNTASVLRDQVAQLKQKVLRHVNSGCQLVVSGKMEAF